MKERPIRVLAADDSAVMRGVLRTLFARQAEAGGAAGTPPVTLCAVAADGAECIEMAVRLRPDVLLLDLEMPRGNGLDVLERLKRDFPELPVIMCSSYTETGARTTLDALARGAADYVMKPGEQVSFDAALETLSGHLLPRIVALTRGRAGAPKVQVTERGREPKRGRDVEDGVDVVVIGVSTGGPSALEQMLPRLPGTFPVPVLIVQHMPRLFTGELAERLNRSCALEVRQAYDGAPLRPGCVWIAPGDSHMEVTGRSSLAIGAATGKILLQQAEPLHHCRPSADYLFHSAAKLYGSRAMALVMTGMGSDGLAGARAIYEGGGVVLAQDEATSAVWGMPGRVAQAGIAQAILPLDEIADELSRRVGRGPAAPAAEWRGIPFAARQRGLYGLL